VTKNTGRSGQGVTWPLRHPADPPIDLERAVILGGARRVNGHVDRESRTVRHEVETSSPRRGWTWFQRDQKAFKAPMQRQEGRDGQGMISMALSLLSVLAVGLLSVSVAAQYRLVIAERHQKTASEVEALSLDIGMMILSLLALALSRVGRRSTPERWGIVGTALASAAMNFGAAQSDSWRSVMVYTLPSLFLAYVIDRAVSVVRRHFLGLDDERSPFALAAKLFGAFFRALGVAIFWIARAAGIFLLYVLRLFLAPWSTLTGLRRAVMIAAKLPDKPVKVVVIRQERPKKDRKPIKGEKPKGLPAGQWAPRAGTKTALMIDAAAGETDLATIAPDKIAELATRKGAEVGLDGGAARAALGKWVKQLQGASQPKELPAGGKASAEQDGGAE
jgi:hypothetical protein